MSGRTHETPKKRICKGTYRKIITKDGNREKEQETKEMKGVIRKVKRKGRENKEGRGCTIEERKVSPDTLI